MLHEKHISCEHGVVIGDVPSYRDLSQFPYLQGNGAWYTDVDYIDGRVISAYP